MGKRCPVKRIYLSKELQPDTAALSFPYLEEGKNFFCANKCTSEKHCNTTTLLMNNQQHYLLLEDEKLFFKS